MPSSIENLLPVRRIYNPSNNEISLSLKFPNTRIRRDEESKRTLLKIKMSAINFLSDFNETNMVIPSHRIIGKIPNSSFKYLLFPFTNCRIESIHDESCNCNLTYGIDIDGGLQECIEVPKKLLLPIHRNISLHDVCFIFDILLPFYINIQNLKGKSLILLNDVEKELNEILIVLNHFKIHSSSVVILDKVETKYENTFDTVFCFNPKLIKFAELSCISTGLTSTKQRYAIHTTFPITAKSIDKTYNYINLTYQHKFSCIEALKILSSLNSKRDEAKSESTIKSTSTDSSNSSQSHYSWIWYDKDVNLFKLGEFEDNHDEEAVIKEMNSHIKKKDLHRVCYLNKKCQNEFNACII